MKKNIEKIIAILIVIAGIIIAVKAIEIFIKNDTYKINHIKCNYKVTFIC